MMAQRRQLLPLILLLLLQLTSWENYSAAALSGEAPAPPTEVTKNPLGDCHGDGEFWLAEGCNYGYYCSSGGPNPDGEYLYCNDVSIENEHLLTLSEIINTIISSS